MIPYKDDNPQLITPYATYSLVILNIFCWLVVQNSGVEPEFTKSICEYALFSTEFTNENLTNDCQKNNIGITGIFSSMFLHGSWLHLLGNMLFLWIFGGNVEDSMGSFRFIIFYFISGSIAAFFQIISDLDSIVPMVGASGAIGGVMGAYILLYPRVKVHIFVFFILAFPLRIPAYVMLGYWFGLQLISGITTDSSSGGVAFWAHVGGFLGGAILSVIFKDEELLCGHEYYGWSTRKDPKNIWEIPENKHKHE